MNKTNSKPLSILICTVVYLIAIAAGWVSVHYFQNYFDLLISTLLADIVATVVVFLFSTIFSNASMYDAYWSVAPLVIVWFWIISTNAEIVFTEWLIFGVVLLWSVRLTANWLRGWRGMQHEDWRYIQLRKESPKLYPFVNFAGIHLFPTLIVFGCMLPLYYALKEFELTLNITIIIGLIISTGATLIAFIADEQMRTFRKTASANESMKTGLWKHSRHPNYLGEILFWFGVWIIAVGANINLYWSIIGCILLALMFLFISIPMMEKRNLTKRKSYAEVIKNVPMLFKWIW